MTNGPSYNHAFGFQHSHGLACPTRVWMSLKQCHETQTPTQTSLPPMGTLATPPPPPHQPLAPHQGCTIEVGAWLPYEWAVWGAAQAFVGSLCVYLVGFNPNPPVNPTHVPIATQNLEDIWGLNPTLIPKPLLVPFPSFQGAHWLPGGLAGSRGMLGCPSTHPLPQAPLGSHPHKAQLTPLCHPPEGTTQVAPSKETRSLGP